MLKMYIFHSHLADQLQDKTYLKKKQFIQNYFKFIPPVTAWLTTLNIVAKWLALLLPIQEVLGSNLILETDYPEVFVIFFSPFRQMAGQYLKLRHDYFLPYPFQFIIH
jgi:hypothetical protein